MGTAAVSGGKLLVEPRLVTEDDVCWVMELSHRRYSNRYDFNTAEGWLRNIVLKQPVMFLAQRTSNAFCISMLSLMPWLPSEPECSVVFICCEQNAMWEGIQLLRASIEWGKQRRCAVWRISSDTDYDLKMIAHRLGATELSPRYVLRY